MEKISEVQTLSNMHRYCWRRKPGKIAGNGQKAERRQEKRLLRLCHRNQGKRPLRESVKYIEGIL